VALAPADFYAYSRATGQPYPESPEERAMQAPQVLEFRRNQLKATESRDTNPVALGVGIALGLAGLGGAGLAARRMLRSGKTTGQSGISQVDLSDADFSNVRRAGAVNLKTTPTTVEPSKVATAPTRRDPFDLSSYAETSSASPQQTVDINAEVDAAVNRLLNDPGLLKYVEAEEAAEIMKQPAMRAEQARQQAQVRRARSAAADDILLEIRSEPINTLVSQQQETGVFNVRQAIAALESGEDQQTGRIKSQLQRNEDLNLNQIGVLENVAAQEPSLMVEQDGPINRVASQLPDGLPVDQAEDALGFAQNRMREIRAAQEAQGYRGLKAEQQMLQGAEGTRLKQAAELYAATGDPNVLSLIAENPSVPLVVQPTSQQLIATQSSKGSAPSELSTSSLYSPFKQRELNVDTQEGVDVRMTNRISGLGSTLEATPKIIINPEYAALEEQTNMAMYAMQQGDPIAANVYNQNRQKFREGKVPPREIINPEYLTLSQQIQEAESVRSEARNIIEKQKSSVEEFPSVYKVADLQEGVRAFYQQTPEGQIIPETLEVRTGRKTAPAGVVEKPASGSSIRGLRGAVEMETYIPVERELASTAAAEMAMGPKIGMDPQRREAMVSSPVRWDPTLHSPFQRTPEGFVYTEEAMSRPTSVASKSFSTRPSSPSDVARTSVDVSETIRRLQSSRAPGAQQQLNQYIQSLRSKGI
jgi:hypothetical protein